MPRIGYVALLGIAMGTAGCGSRDAVVLTSWSPTPSRQTLAGSTGYGKLVAIGEEIDRQAQIEVPKDKKGRPMMALTERTIYFPQQRTDALKLLGNTRGQALSAITKGMPNDYSPVGLQTPPTYLKGLRLLGSSLIWDIEDAINKQNPDAAIKAACQATRLGCALMGGGGYEATLGTSLIDQARTKITPLLPTLGAGQLGNLAAGMQSAYAVHAPISQTIKNETDNMLWTLQEAQDMVAAKKLTQLEEQIGISSKDALDNLRNIQDKPAKVKDVFDWIGNDIRARSAWIQRRAETPRDAGRPPELIERTNWKMLYRYFATNLDNLVPQVQATTAKTQLLILECYLRQKMKLKQPLPANLKKFSKESVRDPFTGEPFFYRAGAKDFDIYSAGEDGVDNGGETNSAFKAPDLRIEVGS